jgi:hypothetical protein
MFFQTVGFDATEDDTGFHIPGFLTPQGSPADTFLTLME